MKPYFYNFCMFNQAKFDKYVNVIFILFIFLIILFGIYVRVKNYVYAAPLWSDEMALARSVVRENWLDLFVNLECDQKSPPLFLLLVYVCTKIAGISEYSIRLISLIAGVSSIILFFSLCKRVFISRFPIILSMLIFVLSEPLIFYSKEFKQYSMDLFLFLVLALIYRHVKFEEMNKKIILIYSLFIIFFMFSSIPMVFIIPAFLFLKLCEKKLSIVQFFYFLPSILFCYVFYILQYYDLMSFETKHQEWQNGFVSFSFSSFLSIFENFYEYIGVDFLISSLLFFIGLVVFLCSKNEDAKFLSVVLLFSFLASILRLYPLSTRVILFLAPIFIIFMIKPFDIGVIFFKNEKLEVFKNIIICIVAIYLLFCGHKLLDKYNFVLNNRAERFESAERRMLMKKAMISFLDMYNAGDKIVSSSELDDFSKYYNISLGYNHTLEHIYYYDEQVNEPFSNISIDGKNNYWFLGYKNVFCSDKENLYCLSKQNFQKNIEKFLKNKNLKHKIYQYEYEEKNINDDDEFLFYKIIFE